MYGRGLTVRGGWGPGPALRAERMTREPFRSRTRSLRGVVVAEVDASSEMSMYEGVGLPGGSGSMVGDRCRPRMLRSGGSSA